jgi:hypothetical protein
MVQKSPLKSRPLRIPGESLDREIDRWSVDVMLPYFISAALLCALASMEWLAYFTHAPRNPILFSGMAALALIVATWQIFRIKNRVRQLKLGRDGERVVGQFLERLREDGAQVFHDVPGDGFNLDHVIISPNGIYVVETKTRSKPFPNARVQLKEGALLVAGYAPDRDPISQVTAASRWLERLLEDSTGKRFAVRGVVVFPGWFVEAPGETSQVWVLEPKQLPALIARQSQTISLTDVKLASFHLSRFIRTEAESAK